MRQPIRRSSTAAPKTVLTPLEKVAVTVAAQTCGDRAGQPGAACSPISAPPSIPRRCRQSCCRRCSRCWRNRPASIRISLAGHQDRVPEIRAVPRSLAGVGFGAQPQAPFPISRRRWSCCGRRCNRRSVRRRPQQPGAIAARTPRRADAERRRPPSASRSCPGNSAAAGEAAGRRRSRLQPARRPRRVFALLLKDGPSPRATLNLLQEALQETRQPARGVRDCRKMFPATR